MRDLALVPRCCHNVVLLSINADLNRYFFLPVLLVGVSLAILKLINLLDEVETDPESSHSHFSSLKPGFHYEHFLKPPSRCLLLHTQNNSLDTPCSANFLSCPISNARSWAKRRSTFCSIVYNKDYVREKTRVTSADSIQNNGIYCAEVSLYWKLSLIPTSI